MNESEPGDFGKMNNNEDRESFVVVICILNALMIFVTITSNALVFAAIWTTPSLRSPSIVFLSNLAVSDFLVGLVVEPVLIADSLEPGLPGISHARKTFSPLFCGVSLCTTAAISVDRCLALHYHMRYPTLMTKERAMYTAVALWVICLLFSCVSFWEFHVYALSMGVLIAVCILISSFSYIKIYCIVRHHQLQIIAQQKAIESFNFEHNEGMLQSKKSAINTFIFYILMVLCYSPVLIYMVILTTSPSDLPKAWMLAETVAYLNSSINPFLFCWRLGELRVAVLKTLKKIFGKGTGDS